MVLTVDGMILSHPSYEIFYTTHPHVALNHSTDSNNAVCLEWLHRLVDQRVICQTQTTLELDLYLDLQAVYSSEILLYRGGPNY